MTSGQQFVKRSLLRCLQFYAQLTDRFGASKVIVYYGWPDFALKANALAHELIKAGIPAEVRTGTGFFTRARIKYSRKLHIGFWNHYYPDYLPARFIFFNAEPLKLPRWRDNVEWQQLMQGALQVWGYSEHDREYVTTLRLPFHHVPFGYSEYYERSYRRNLPHEKVTEDIDVLFVGFVSERRRGVIDRIEASGLKVKVVTYDHPVRGRELDHLIARSRIVLSMFMTDNPEAQVADFARLDHLLSNGRFVLHECLPAGTHDPAFEQHIPTSPYDQIAARCVHFVRNPEVREQAAFAARQWFREQRRFSAFLPIDEVRRLASDRQQPNSSNSSILTR